MKDDEQEMYAGVDSENLLALMNKGQFASFLSLSEKIARTISEYDQDHLTMTDFLSLVYCEAGNRGNASYEAYANEDEVSEEEEDEPAGIVIDGSIVFQDQGFDGMSSLFLKAAKYFRTPL